MSSKGPKVEYSDLNLYVDHDFPFDIDPMIDRQGGGAKHPVHVHSDSLELQYIYCGNGQYFVGDRFHDVQPHMVCVIPADTPHAYVKSDAFITLNKTSLTFPSSLLRGHMPEKALAKWLRLAKEPARQRLVLGKQATVRVEGIISFIIQEWKGKAPLYREAICGYLRQILIEIERAWNADIHGREKDSHDIMMDSLLTLVDTSFKEPLALADLAKHVNRSVCHISHIFTQTKGITFTEYLTARRVVEARRMLETDDRKVFAVAMESGFASLSSFNRAFHRIVGMSPSRYRGLHKPGA